MGNLKDIRNETSFVSDIKSGVDSDIEKKNLPLSNEVEPSPIGDKKKRSDWLTKDRNTNKNLLNIEFRKVDSARNSELIEDAREKSELLCTPYFATSNFNELLPFRREDINNQKSYREIRLGWKVGTERKKDDSYFGREEHLKDMQHITLQCILYVWNIINEKIKPFHEPLGESFVDELKIHRNELSEILVKYIPEYQDDNLLKKWWINQELEPIINFKEEDKKHIADYISFRLIWKTINYYGMRKSFKDLPDIKIKEIKDIDQLKGCMEGAYGGAEKHFGGFKNYFESEYVDELLYKDNNLVEPIKRLVTFLSERDTEKIDNNILGKMFEELILIRKRHLLGQYYTDIPIVRLINALTIKNANAKVLDPACGVGTFLDESFELKMKLSPENDTKEKREKMFEQIYGVDIAEVPVCIPIHLLSSKLLYKNPFVYPRIIKKDFLQVDPVDIRPKFDDLLRTYKTDSTTRFDGEKKEISFEPVDAVIGNLPYIRQEIIKNKDMQIERINQMLQQHGYEKEILNEQSDFYVYFFYYILPFLKEGSMIGFLTSSTWLSTKYGNSLLKFINKYFKILAIIDSSIERWFPVYTNTCITILQRTSNDEDRKNNKIKFVRINTPIKKLIPDIESSIRISEIIEQGRSNTDVTITNELKQQDIDFTSKLKSKLYPYLIAPKEFFDIANHKEMIKLSEIINLQRGITTGSNDFFIVNDITNKYTDDKTHKKYGLRRGEVENIRIIKNGRKEEFLMEKEYLQPFIKSIEDIAKKGTLNFQDKTKKYIVTIEEKDKSKIKKYANEYIKHGENIGCPDIRTIKNRKSWWLLNPLIKPDIVFPRILKESILYPKANYYLHDQLYLATMKDAYKDDLLLIYSFMNSTLSYLYRDIYGRDRVHMTYCTVEDTENFPIPNPKIMKPYYEKLEQIMHKIEQRRIGNVFEEIGWNGEGQFLLTNVQSDRLELDRTILTALGFKEPNKFLERWYQLVVQIIKQRLDKASNINTDKSAKSKGKVNLDKIADNILSTANIKNFPNDYLSENDIKEKIEIKLDAKIEWNDDLLIAFGPKCIELNDGKRYIIVDKYAQKYIEYCLKRGLTIISIPKDAQSILKDFEEDLSQWRLKIIEEIQSTTKENDYQEKLRKICERKTNYNGILF